MYKFYESSSVYRTQKEGEDNKFNDLVFFAYLSSHEFYTDLL